MSDDEDDEDDEQQQWKGRLSKMSRRELFPEDRDIYELSRQIRETLERLKKSRESRQN